MNVKYKLGGKEIELELNGSTFVGSDEVLLLQDENLIENTDWKEIVDFLIEADFVKIKDGSKSIIGDLILEAGGQIDENFELENYHLYVNNEIHLNLQK